MTEDITDNFKIMTNRAILGFKDNNKKDFANAVKYIIQNLKLSDIDTYTNYLFRKLESEE